MDTPKLLEHRKLKFRAMGGFQEGIPADPEKKSNMKKKEEPVVQKGELSATLSRDLEDEVEKLREQILKSKESSSPLPELGLVEMIEKLRREVDQEFSEAVKSLGLKDQLEMLRKEFAKARGTPDQLVEPGLTEKIGKIKEEFNQRLPEAPNFASLSYKIDMLKEISKAKQLSEQNGKVASLKQEINKRLKELMDQSELKEKMEELKAEMASSTSADGEIDLGLKEKLVKVKKEIELKMTDVLKSLHLDVDVVSSKQGGLTANDFNEQPLNSDLKTKIEELNDEINEGIEHAVNSSDLKNKIEMLKLELVKAGKSPDPVSENKINALKQQIKQSLAEALSSPMLVQKHEKLKQEIVRAKESESLALNFSQGSLEGDLKQDVSRVEVTHGHNLS